MLSRFRGRTVCPDCKGTRIRKDASFVKIAGKSITDMVLLPIDKALPFFETLELTETERNVSQRLLKEIVNTI